MGFKILSIVLHYLQDLSKESLAGGMGEIDKGIKRYKLQILRLVMKGHEWALFRSP